jgi:hypothetical protein
MGSPPPRLGQKCGPAAYHGAALAAGSALSGQQPGLFGNPAMHRVQGSSPAERGSDAKDNPVPGCKIRANAKGVSRCRRRRCPSADVVSLASSCRQRCRHPGRHDVVRSRQKSSLPHRYHIEIKRCTVRARCRCRHLSSFVVIFHHRWVFPAAAIGTGNPVPRSVPCPPPLSQPANFGRLTGNSRNGHLRFESRASGPDSHRR